MSLPEYVHLIDTGLFGYQKYGASYVIGSSELALVDPGTSNAVSTIANWFTEASADLSDLTGVILTHIHLDHAGATGELVRMVPDLKVYVHERGAPHLVDPAGLIESVKQATGDRFSEYGTFTPVPQENIVPIKNETTISIGNLDLMALPTSGHAPHHISYLEKESQVMFPGDSAGLYVDHQLIPTTPPPSFNLKKSLSSLEKMKEKRPSTFLFPHFGVATSPLELMEKYQELLANWVDSIRSKYLAGTPREELNSWVVKNFDQWLGNGFTEEELLMNLSGVIRYLSWRNS